MAVYTNVTSDHLDRHGSLEAYQRVKRLLAEKVDPGGALVLNAEDPIVAGYADVGTARAVRYRRGEPPTGGLGVVDGWIVANGVVGLQGAASTDGPILPVDELGIPGAHNVSNALAAVAVGSCSASQQRRSVRRQRRSPASSTASSTSRPIDGVRFINDSQGTQPDAVIAALEAFPAPVVLIAGGRDKGVDLSALGPVVAARASAAVLIGESAPDLERRFRDAGLSRTERVETLDEAVGRADALAREALTASSGAAPATVLLSPAAASFDMFPDYAARGRAFKDAVADLVAARARSRP